MSVICPVCDLLYCPDLAADRRYHARHHERHLRLCQEYGELPGYGRREEMKGEANALMRVPEATAADLVHAAEIYLRAWFARSVLTFDDKKGAHPSFEVYVAAMLANRDPDPFGGSHPALPETR